MFDNDYDILTLQEMAEELQIGLNYAYALLKTKRIDAFRVGRSWRIPRASIKKYINQSILENQERQSNHAMARP